MFALLYKIRLGLALLAGGFSLLGYGLPACLNSEIEDGYIDSFGLRNGVYRLQATLDKTNNDYYVVVRFDGKARIDIISDINVNLISNSKIEFSQRLATRGSRTVKSEKPGWFGKQAVLGYLSIEEDKNYTLEINNILHHGTIENPVFSLHSGSNRWLEVIVVFLSLALMFSGGIFIIIGSIKHGYNNALQRLNR